MDGVYRVTRVMYDGINLATVPTGALEAGYVGGHWTTFPLLRARFPLSELVSIAISANERAQVYDFERGDLTAQQVLTCVVRDRAAGLWPTCYCSTFNWPQIVAVFAANRVVLPPWWRADYNGHAALELGEIAHQYASLPGYDVSIVADYWPGVDPDPALNPAPMEEALSRLIYADPNGSWYLYDGYRKRPVHPGEPQTLADLGFVPQADATAPKWVSPAELATIPNDPTYPVAA
jgi:hypothetical protein